MDLVLMKRLGLLVLIPVNTFSPELQWSHGLDQGRDWVRANKEAEMLIGGAQL